MSENEMDEDVLRDIPPFLRLPKNGTREATELAIQWIDVKVEQLKKLGLRPHPGMLEYRQELTEQLQTNGPYRCWRRSTFDPRAGIRLTHVSALRTVASTGIAGI